MGYRSAVSVVVYGDKAKVKMFRDLMMAKHFKPGEDVATTQDTNLYLTHLVFDNNPPDTWTTTRYAEWMDINGKERAGYQADFDEIKWYDDCQHWFSEMVDLIREINEEMEGDPVLFCECLRFGEEDTDIEYIASDSVMDVGDTMLQWSRRLETTHIERMANENHSSRQPAQHQA